MRSFAFFVGLFLASCTCDCDADRFVQQFAAPNAVDCRRASTLEEREAVLRCVEDAIARGEPFLGGWPLEGIDSEVRAYVAENAEGAVWRFAYGGAFGGACPTLHASRCTTPLARQPTDFGGSSLGCGVDVESRIDLCR